MDIGGIAMSFISRGLLPGLFTFSLAVYIWGTLGYLIQGKYDEEAREKAKAVITYGILVFAVMFLIWGGVRIATGH